MESDFKVRNISKSDSNNFEFSKLNTRIACKLQVIHQINATCKMHDKLYSSKNKNLSPWKFS
jgi:hypothetical protein